MVPRRPKKGSQNDPIFGPLLAKKGQKRVILGSPAPGQNRQRNDPFLTLFRGQNTTFWAIFGPSRDRSWPGGVQFGLNLQ